MKRREQRYYFHVFPPSVDDWYTLPEPFQLDEFESDSDSDSNGAESEEIVEESHKKIGETDESIDEI